MTAENIEQRRVSLSAELNRFIAELKGAEVLYCPNPGNGGDSLIAAATYQLLRRNGIAFRTIRHDDVGLDVSGKVVIYGGGGVLIPRYPQGRLFIERYHAKARRLIVLPQTIVDQEKLLGGLGANVDVIARDPVSYEHVRASVTAAQAHLMHDAALALDLEALRRTPLRFETPRMLEAAKLVRHWTRRLRLTPPPGPTLQCFREDTERTQRPIPPDNLDVPYYYRAGVAPEALAVITTRDVLDLLDRYATIRTNRLHMCIAGVILGKKVEFEDNAYGKNRRIFDHSIRNIFPNVTWTESAAASAA